LAFEKERRNNNIMMTAGAIAAVAGAVVLFTVNRAAGVLILIVGISLLVIGFSVSNVLYKIKMVELFEGRNKSNEK